MSALVDYSMTPAKLEQRLQGQSSIARKVYAAVPIQAAWSVAEIVGALRKSTGSSIDHHTVIKSMLALKAAGVIGEPRPGLFKRVEVKDVPAVEKEKPLIAAAALAAPVAQPASAAPRPIDVIAPIAVGLTAVFEQIRKLVTDLEDAVLLIESSMAEQDANLDKLRQLQSILKSLA